jgi:hypothetical protein
VKSVAHRSGDWEVQDQDLLAFGEGFAAVLSHGRGRRAKESKLTVASPLPWED